ncbi:MAG: hypothetical protein JWM80_5633, partial [Cyanobacteria bacterium RYN_339]|nr:hypothetical protein [Cyanobacteria bacterium RYN_339]
MRRIPVLVLAALLALPACQVKAPDAARASTKPTAAKGSAPAPTPPQLLKPGSGSVNLQGQVSMDAGYARAHANARALGAGAIALDGGHAQGTGIANTAGQIVAQGGGNVIVPPGIISNDGGSLIGNDGGGLIGNDGGGLIGNDGASFHLAQAESGSLGESLPAAGMWLSVVDGRTGQPLPLGVDDQGQPVTTIYTDAEGRFAVHLPAELAANVRVVARAPGSSDPRLALHVFETPKAASARAVDESTAAATGYLRYLMADLMVKLGTSSLDRVAGILAETIQRGDKNENNPAVKVFLAAATPPLRTIRDAMVQANLQALPAVRQYDICLRAADLLLADMDLAGTKLDFTFYTPIDEAVKAKAGRPAFDAFAESLETLRQAAGKQAGAARDNQAAFTAFFAAKPYLLAANVAHPGTCRSVAKPSDICDFAIKEYFATADLSYIAPVDHVFYDLGLPTADRDLMRCAGLN